VHSTTHSSCVTVCHITDDGWITFQIWRSADWPVATTLWKQIFLIVAHWSNKYHVNRIFSGFKFHSCVANWIWIRIRIPTSWIRTGVGLEKIWVRTPLMHAVGWLKTHDLPTVKFSIQNFSYYLATGTPTIFGPLRLALPKQKIRCHATTWRTCWTLSFTQIYFITTTVFGFCI